jgi:hypothetical protein
MVRKAQKFKDFTTEHLRCRATSHSWEPVETYLIRVEGRPAYETTLKCTVCSRPKDPTFKTDTIFVSDGTRPKHPPYHYTNGYLVEDIKSWGGTALLKRNSRVELYGRYLVTENGTKNRRAG